VFDAWVANRDRHEENWSVLRNPAGGGHAGGASYDHGSSLAFGDTDDRRRKILSGNPSMEHWAARGTAWRFEGGSSTTLVDFACDALKLVHGRARDFWLEQLRSVKPSAVDGTIAAIPEMSEVASTFCLRLLEVNRRRLLDVC
jgi:hypothetical protein